MTHPIAMMKICTAALLFAAAILLAQGEPASAAPYNGDIGETRFTSLDQWDNQSTFILKRYTKPNGGSGGGTVLVTPEPEQGTYEIVDPTQEAGRWNRSFDYDPKSGVLTLYDDGGPTERWTFLPWKGWDPGDVKVEHLVPGNSAYDAVYEWQESRSAYVAYIPGIGERTLPEYILNVQGAFNMMKEDLDQGKEWELQGDAYGEFISFVVRKTKKKASAAPQASPAVHWVEVGRYTTREINPYGGGNNTYSDWEWLIYIDTDSIDVHSDGIYTYYGVNAGRKGVNYDNGKRVYADESITQDVAFRFRHNQQTGEWLGISSFLLGMSDETSKLVPFDFDTTATSGDEAGYSPMYGRFPAHVNEDGRPYAPPYSESDGAEAETGGIYVTGPDMTITYLNGVGSKFTRVGVAAYVIRALLAYQNGQQITSVKEGVVKTSY